MSNKITTKSVTPERIDVSDMKPGQIFLRGGNYGIRTDENTFVYLHNGEQYDVEDGQQGVPFYGELTLTSEETK